MRKILSLILPISAGVALVFFGLPLYGGNLDILVQKLALDWEIPVVAARILLSVAAALILTLLFQMVKRVALWLAIVVVMAAIFAPALLSNVPFVSDEVKTIVEQKLNL